LNEPHVSTNLTLNGSHVLKKTSPSYTMNFMFIGQYQQTQPHVSKLPLNMIRIPFIDPLPYNKAHSHMLEHFQHHQPQVQRSFSTNQPHFRRPFSTK
jgi:hypothetical protein